MDYLFTFWYFDSILGSQNWVMINKTSFRRCHCRRPREKYRQNRIRTYSHWDTNNFFSFLILPTSQRLPRDYSMNPISEFQCILPIMYTYYVCKNAESAQETTSQHMPDHSQTNADIADMQCLGYICIQYMWWLSYGGGLA